MDAFETAAIATISVAVVVSPILLFAFGLLWAPIGAFICNRIAHSRGLPAVGYTEAGAGYSALMFLPWVYLVARMCNWRLPRSVILAGYVYVYTLWLALIIGYAAFIFTEVIPYSNYLRAGSGGLADGREGQITLWFAATSINIFTLAHSVRALRRASARDRTRLGKEPREVLPGGAYVHPFAWLIGWGLAFLVLWAIAFASQ